MVTLRELISISNYAAKMQLFGVDADAAETLRLGRTPVRGVTPLYIGAVGYAAIDDDLEDYKDRKVLRFAASGDSLVVYQRLLGAREEIEDGDVILNGAGAGAPVPAGG